jgi:hypothetical protein
MQYFLIRLIGFLMNLFAFFPTRFNPFGLIGRINLRQ